MHDFGTLDATRRSRCCAPSPIRRHFYCRDEHSTSKANVNNNKMGKQFKSLISLEAIPDDYLWVLLLRGRVWELCACVFSHARQDVVGRSGVNDGNESTLVPSEKNVFRNGGFGKRRRQDIWPLLSCNDVAYRLLAYCGIDRQRQSAHSDSARQPKSN